MEQLRVKSKNIYKIQVNDKGEFIEFDLEDIGLKVKCYEALDDIQKITEKYQKMLSDKKEVSDKELTTIEDSMFKEMRYAMDKFLGEGACQKIFGNRNYYTMFDDLLKELTRKRPELNNKSHFDMLELNAKSVNDRIMNKYNKKVKNVI